MAKKENARYGFTVTDILLKPLNADLTQPSADNIIGGVGPFDYSGASAIAAVPLITKIDATAAETVTVDLSPAVDDAAVTVDELVTAINLAAPTSVTASKDATSGRLKLVFATGTEVQIYGELAQLAEVGQGFGQRIIYSDTMQSFSDSPTAKDEETFTITDALGIDTEVISDGYRKGVSGVLTETAQDYLTRSLIEGGVYDEANLVYEAPTSLTDKRYFKIEVYSSVYRFGTNKVGDLVGYVKQEIFSCKGTFGDRTRERGIGTSVYNYTATSPRDVDGNITADTKETQLTVAQYEALQLDKLAVA